MKIVILDKMPADSQCCNFINTLLLLFLYIGDVFSDIATGELFNMRRIESNQTLIENVKYVRIRSDIFFSFRILF